MSSAASSPVSHHPLPLNINYDSDEEDLRMDSGNEHHSNRREPDADADGESIDEDASPPPSHRMGLHRVGFPSSLHHEVSVCFQYFVCVITPSL